MPAAGGDPIEDHIDVNTHGSEQGLLGIVPDPAFATNQYIYVYADKPGNTDEARNNRHRSYATSSAPTASSARRRSCSTCGLKAQPTMTAAASTSTVATTWASATPAPIRPRLRTVTALA